MLQTAHRLSFRVEHRLWAELPGMTSKPRHEPDRPSKGLLFLPWSGGCLPCQEAPAIPPGPEPYPLCLLYTFTNIDRGSRRVWLQCSSVHSLTPIGLLVASALSFLCVCPCFPPYLPHLHILPSDWISMILPLAGSLRCLTSSRSPSSAVSGFRNFSFL